MFKCAMAFLWSLFIAFFILLCLTSCEYNKVITPDSEAVQIKLDYSLPFTSGSRSVEAEDVYDEYYEQQILTRKLTPKNFELTLYNDFVEQYSISGFWGKDNSLCPKVGSYRVRGTSKPKINSTLSDTVSLKFDAEIEITKNQTEIIIPASYSNCLLLFKDENIKSIYGYCTEGQNMQFEPHDGLFGIYLNPNPNNSSYVKEYNRLEIIFNDNKKYIIYYDDCGFEVGKYYYFNLATMGFDLPKMENGNG